MKGKLKKAPTRKQTALRRCATLAAVVVLASVTRIYNFLPIQAVRVMADINDMQHPEVVKRFHDGSLPVTRFALYYLVEDGDALMLCATGYHPLAGWYDRAWAKAETWDDAPLHGGIYTHTQGDKQSAWVYGRIENDAIKRVTLCRVMETEVENDFDFAYFPVPEEDVFERNGKRYILTQLHDFREGSAGWTTYSLLGETYGPESSLPECEIDCRSWSTGK